jgi:hypothetical protein
MTGTPAATTNLIDALLEKATKQLNNLIGETDPRYAQALTTYKTKLNELNEEFNLASPEISLNGLEQSAAASLGKAAVKSLEKTSNVAIKDMDGRDIGLEMAQAAAKTIIGKGITDKAIKQTASTALGKVFNLDENSLKTALEEGSKAKAHAVNGFERYGVALGAAFLAYNRIRAVFKPKTVYNEQTQQEERVSKPWYSKVGNILLAAGFGILAVKVGVQGHSTKQALTDMTKPVLGKWTAQMGAQSTKGFSGFQIT